MKTPEEIKKGLECCRNVWVNDHWKNCDGLCPYQTECSYCKNALHDDALAYIRQLEAERDAAVKCIGKLMVILKKYPYAATNGCAYQAYMTLQDYLQDIRGLPEPPKENGGKENDRK